MSTHAGVPPFRARPEGGLGAVAARRGAGSPATVVGVAATTPIPSATAACAIATLYSIGAERPSTPGRMCAWRSINGRPSAEAARCSLRRGF
jgi:hypothetical protein